MFKENNDHKQLKMFGYEGKLNQHRRNMLEKGWPALFYEQVFSK
ncbi:MAG: hypothetical protein PWR10_2097 [Halanaerobiales bacterium]|nr:hypothetical protein [Halanaerobiales bacterium]